MVHGLPRLFEVQVNTHKVCCEERSSVSIAWGKPNVKGCSFEFQIKILIADFSAPMKCRGQIHVDSGDIVAILDSSEIVVVNYIYSVWDIPIARGISTLKKALVVTLCLTAVAILLFYISDIAFETAYLGVTVFQPIPHLILFSLAALDLYFWHQVRNNSQKESKSANRKKWLDYFILFLLAALIFSTLLLVFDPFLPH